MTSSILFLSLCTLLTPGMSHILDFSFKPNSENIQWPSCEELRTLWLYLMGLTDLEEITNEIPLIPQDLFVKYHQKNRLRNNRLKISPDYHHLESTPKLTDKGILLTDGKFISEMLPKENKNILHINNEKLLPQENTPFNSILNAKHFFDDFQVSKSASPPFDFNTIYKEEELLKSLNGESLQSGEHKSENEQTPSLENAYGLKEDVGSFGEFSKEDENALENPSNIEMIKIDNSEWSSQPIRIGSRFETPTLYVSENICKDTFGKSCSTDENCLCVGIKPLICISGRCQNSHESLSELKNIGTWHEGPLLPFQLGVISQRRRRARKFQFNV